MSHPPPQRRVQLNPQDGSAAVRAMEPAQALVPVCSVSAASALCCCCCSDHSLADVSMPQFVRSGQSAHGSLVDDESIPLVVLVLQIHQPVLQGVGIAKKQLLVRQIRRALPHTHTESRAQSAVSVAPERWLRRAVACPRSLLCRLLTMCISAMACAVRGGRGQAAHAL